MNKNIITFSVNGKGVSSSYLSFQTPRLFLNGEMSLFSLPSSSSNFVDSYVWGGRKRKKSNPNEPPSRELGNLLIFSNLTLIIWVRNCARCWSNTALWQPCLFLSASLGLKGLLGVALSYSALSTSNQTFFSEGEQKKKRKRSAEDRAGRNFPEGCQGERTCTEIVAMKPIVLSLLMPHHFLLGKREGK